MFECEKRLEIDKKVAGVLSTIWSIIRSRYEKFELYLVGGCVRDLLLNRTPKDYDLCTNLTPEEIVAIFEDVQRFHIIETGIKHGTVTLHDVVTDLDLEITTFRSDGVYEDSRHPKEVTFVKSLEEDLKRRDFTINSFAYDFTFYKLKMLDERFLNDLEFGIIRTVGDPAERFEEDALRMLRALRFAAQLNFSLDKLTYSAISMCAPLLAKISKERIRDELTKILMSDNPQYLELFVISGLEEYAFDGYMPIKAMVDCEHQNPWHYTTVFHHTIDVVRMSPKNFISRWSAFLHDSGKPAVKKLKEGTTDYYRYIGHPEESFKIANKLMSLLKFSNNEKEIIGKYVLYHDYPLDSCSGKKFKKMIVEIGEDNFLNFLKLKQADGLSHNMAKSIDFAVDGVSKAKERYLYYLRFPEPLRMKDLKINGDDLKEMGMQGKEIGDTLQYLLEKVLENPNYNTIIELKKLIERRKNG